MRDCGQRPKKSRTHSTEKGQKKPMAFFWGGIPLLLVFRCIFVTGCENSVYDKPGFSEFLLVFLRLLRFRLRFAFLAFSTFLFFFFFFFFL
jgi:hypothetical protein